MTVIISPYLDKNATHKTYTVKAGHALRCSVCQFELFGFEIFCPYCGQKLTEVGNDNNHSRDTAEPK